MEVDIFTVLWVCWGIIFFAVELPAMWAHKRGGTLSEHVWSFMEIGAPPERRSKYYRVKRIVFMAFWAWLSAHFFFQFA